MLPGRAPLRSWDLGLGAHAVERVQHPGGRSPDGALAERNLTELHFVAGNAGTAPEAVVGRIEQVAERHLEGVFDLLARERQLEAGPHERHHGRDAKAGDHDVVGEIADDGDETRVEADLFARFARCCGRRAAVARLDTPAGKADLPGVIAQLRGALREQHGEIGSFDQRNQHRRRHRVGRQEPSPRRVPGLEEPGDQPVLVGVPRHGACKACADDGRPIAMRRGSGGAVALLGCVLHGGCGLRSFSPLHRLPP